MWIICFAIFIFYFLHVYFAADFVREIDTNFKFLNSTCLPYEICLVKLNTLDGKYRYSSQPSCNTSGNSEYPPLILPHQTARSLVKGLLSGCELGFGHGGQGGLTPRTEALNPDGDNCKVRSISQKHGIRSIWKSSEVPDIYSGRIIHIASELKMLNVKRISMLGDSITMQTGKFLGCDLSRSAGIDTIKNYFLLQSANTLDQWADFKYGNHQVSISATKIKIACTYDLAKSEGCTTTNFTDKRDAVYTSLKAAFIAAGSRSRHGDSPTIIIFNAGLHIFPDTKDWMVEPMVRAMLNAAKESQRQYFIFFRETSAQHFNARIGGCYDGPVSPLYRPGQDYCCGALNVTDTIREDWRNRVFREELTRQDPQWRRYIGWIPFFNITMQLSDMHIESNNMWRADCTHYIYTPFIFAPLWHEMMVEITRLLNDFQPYNITSLLSERLLEGKLIRSGKKVWIVQSGKRRHFSNYDVLVEVSRGRSHTIEPFTDNIMSHIPIGTDMTSQDMVKISK